MKILFYSLTLLFFARPSFAEQGFIPSEDRNVLYLIGDQSLKGIDRTQYPFPQDMQSITFGATAFAVNLPKIGKVLLTQAHVVDATKINPRLCWGVENGPLYQIKNISPEAFCINFDKNIIWKNDELDVAILKFPSELNQLITGLNIENFAPGKAQVLGYPIIGRRTFPDTSTSAMVLGEVNGVVRQMKSVGNTWYDESGIVGDIDMLPGNSGGPVVNEENNVIGIVKKMKTWSGKGYQYLLPHLEIMPIEEILKSFENDKT